MQDKKNFTCLGTVGKYVSYCCLLIVTSSFHNNMVVHSSNHPPSETCTGKSSFSIISHFIFSFHLSLPFNPPPKSLTTRSLVSRWYISIPEPCGLMLVIHVTGCLLTDFLDIPHKTFDISSHCCSNFDDESHSVQLVPAEDESITSTMGVLCDKCNEWCNITRLRHSCIQAIITSSFATASHITPKFHSIQQLCHWIKHIQSEFYTWTIIGIEILRYR